MVVQMLTLRQMTTVMSNCIKLLLMVVVVAMVTMRPGADLNTQVLKIYHCGTCPLRSHWR